MENFSEDMLFLRLFLSSTFASEILSSKKVKQLLKESFIVSMVV